ncbi:unnamed protein product [Fusarium graminearum]|nr:hypothetical protein FG05_35304 [Fusarium graminearum]CZS74809.1 unnamed protein product [Fusarium graminearum]
MQVKDVSPHLCVQLLSWSVIPISVPQAVSIPAKLPPPSLVPWPKYSDSVPNLALSFGLTPNEIWVYCSETRQSYHVRAL